MRSPSLDWHDGGHKPSGIWRDCLLGTTTYRPALTQMKHLTWNIFGGVKQLAGIRLRSQAKGLRTYLKNLRHDVLKDQGSLTVTDEIEYLTFESCIWCLVFWIWFAGGHSAPASFHSIGACLKCFSTGRQLICIFLRFLYRYFVKVIGWVCLRASWIIKRRFIIHARM